MSLDPHAETDPPEVYHHSLRPGGIHHGEIPSVTEESIPFSLDVESMYTAIPWDKGSECAAFYWNEFKSAELEDHFLTGAAVQELFQFLMSHSIFRNLGEDVNLCFDHYPSRYNSSRRRTTSTKFAT